MSEVQGRKNVSLTVQTLRVDLSPPPRPDGYKELAVALQVWGGVTNYSGPREVFWLVMAGARRLDSAHRQIERVRDGLDQPEGGSGTSTEIALRQRGAVFAVLGDAQLAIIALYRAAVMAEEISAYVTVPFPVSVKRRMDGLKQMRDAYEHVEDRARGNIARGQMDREKAWRAMSVLGEELRGTRKGAEEAAADGLPPAALRERDGPRGAWEEDQVTVENVVLRAAGIADPAHPHDADRLDFPVTMDRRAGFLTWERHAP